MRLSRNKFSSPTPLAFTFSASTIWMIVVGVGCSSSVIGPDRNARAIPPGYTAPGVTNSVPAGPPQALLPPNAISGPATQVVPEGELQHIPLEKVYAPTSRDEAQYHEVQSGDTLSTIARRYGTTANAIERANGLGTSAPLVPGQQLFIPKSR